MCHERVANEIPRVATKWFCMCNGSLIHRYANFRTCLRPGSRLEEKSYLQDYTGSRLKSTYASVQDVFQFSDAWIPFAKPQSNKGMASFLSCLYVVTHRLKSKPEAAKLKVERLLLQLGLSVRPLPFVVRRFRCKHMPFTPSGARPRGLDTSSRVTCCCHFRCREGLVGAELP